MYELEHMVMPLVRQGHKVVQTRAGPGVYFIQLCHPDAIRKGAGSGIVYSQKSPFSNFCNSHALLAIILFEVLLIPRV